MFALDGNQSTITQLDIDRVRMIVKLLVQWNLYTIVDDTDVSKYNIPLLVVPRSQLSQWNLVPKYSIGHYHSKH